MDADRTAIPPTSVKTASVRRVLEAVMFVFTAKLNRRKAVLFLIAFALILAAIILAVSLRGHGRAPRAEHTTVPTIIRTTGDAAAYLTSLGWEVEPDPVEIQEIVIPRSFTGVYADYAALQKKQGFPIEQYGGMDAVRYTFKVKNYPSNEKEVVADLVVSGQSVIAGDIQSTALDGFMTGLKTFPSPGT
jgi:hypothetical protein